MSAMFGENLEEWLVNFIFTSLHSQNLPCTRSFIEVGFQKASNATNSMATERINVSTSFNFFARKAKASDRLY